MNNSKINIESLIDPKVCQNDFEAKSLLLHPQILSRVIKAVLKPYAIVPLDVIENYYLPLSSVCWKDENDKTFQFDLYGKEALDAFNTIHDNTLTPIRKDLHFFLYVPTLNESKYWGCDIYDVIRFDIEIIRDPANFGSIRFEDHISKVMCPENLSRTREWPKISSTTRLLLNQDSYPCNIRKVINNYFRTTINRDFGKMQVEKTSSFYYTLVHLSNFPDSDENCTDPSIQILETLFSKSLSTEEKKNHLRKYGIDLDAELRTEKLSITPYIPYREDADTNEDYERFMNNVRRGTMLAKRVIALRMLERGLKIEDIVLYTELSASEIEQLKKENSVCN